MGGCSQPAFEEMRSIFFLGPIILICISENSSSDLRIRKSEFGFESQEISIQIRQSGNLDLSFRKFGFEFQHIWI